MSDSVIEFFALFKASDWLRVFATVLAIGVAGTAMKWARRIVGLRAGNEPTFRRERMVWLRNIILLSCLALVLSIWASKIAGFALSVAAVAGAMLLVSKELLSSVLGSVVLTFSRPFRIGDFVEIAGVRGRVVDTNWASTTLNETLEGHQLTGRTVVLPNSLLLSQAVRNETATGAYMMQIVRVGADPAADLERLEKCLLQAARNVSASWLAPADRHLAALESRSMVDLPSADPRVLLDLSDSRQAVLALRYVCRPIERVRTEQEILRQYWQAASREGLLGPAFRQARRAADLPAATEGQTQTAAGLAAASS